MPGRDLVARPARRRAAGCGRVSRMPRAAGTMRARSPLARASLVAAVLALVAPFAVSQQKAAPQFTFAWPLSEGALKPRGATTRGAPVTLDTAPAETWKQLREPGLSAQERDRRAILAM